MQLNKCTHIMTRACPAGFKACNIGAGFLLLNKQREAGVTRVEGGRYPQDAYSAVVQRVPWMFADRLMPIKR